MDPLSFKLSINRSTVDIRGRPSSAQIVHIDPECPLKITFAESTIGQTNPLGARKRQSGCRNVLGRKGNCFSARE